MPFGGRFQQPGNNHNNYGEHHFILFFTRLNQKKWQQDCEQAAHYDLKYVLLLSDNLQWVIF